MDMAQKTHMHTTPPGATYVVYLSAVIKGVTNEQSQ